MRGGDDLGWWDGFHSRITSDGHRRCARRPGPSPAASRGRRHVPRGAARCDARDPCWRSRARDLSPATADRAPSDAASASLAARRHRRSATGSRHGGPRVTRHRRRGARARALRRTRRSADAEARRAGPRGSPRRRRDIGSDGRAPMRPPLADRAPPARAEDAPARRARAPEALLPVAAPRHHRPCTVPGAPPPPTASTPANSRRRARSRRFEWGFASLAVDAEHDGGSAAKPTPPSSISVDR